MGSCGATVRPVTSTPETAGFVDEVRAAYATSGPAVQLGALVVDGTAHPDAPVQLPLSVLNRHGLVAGATIAIVFRLLARD